MKLRPACAVLPLLLSSIALMAADKTVPARIKAPKTEKATTEGGAATPAELLTTLAGFKVELLRSAQVGQDSWIAMTMDWQGPAHHFAAIVHRFDHALTGATW